MRWSELPTRKKIAHDDFNTEICSTARFRRQSLSSFSLGTEIVMKNLLFLFLLVFSGHVADATGLNGSWRMKYTEAGGQKHFVAKGISITLTIRNSIWNSVVTPSYPNGSGFRARLATNDTKTPKQIDLYVTSGTPGTVWKGIYEIQGNT